MSKKPIERIPAIGGHVAPERINHPAHYGGDSTYEVIKVIEAWGLGFHTGNAVKYIARAGKKDPSTEIEDLKKAYWYLSRAADQIATEIARRCDQFQEIQK